MTTKTTTKPSSAPERRLAELPGLRELLVELHYYGDVDAELAACVPPLIYSPTPSRALRRKLGVYFDVDEVRRYLVFCRKLRHFKGPLAGRPLIPDMWQVLYVDAPLFGWRRADGTRLYSTLYEEIPRKNGKSTSSAGKALYFLMADSNLKKGRLAEAGAEVYAAATTTRQALEVFRPAENMAKASPALARRLAVLKDKALIYDANASRFEVVSGVSDKAEEKMGLNGSAIVVDELHVHKSRKIVDTLDSSQGAREQPVKIFITTAGVDDPGSIYTEKRDYAEKVAKGELDDDSWLVVIYTLEEKDTKGDRPFQEEVLRKVNPGLGRSVQWSYLERKAREARNSPAALNTFLRLHCNVRTGQVTRYLLMDKWDRSGARWLVPTLDELAGRIAYGGLDLASTTDLAAAAFVLPRWELNPDDRDEEIEVLDVLLRAWTPAETLAERARHDRAPYERWVKDGYLTATPGDVIDYDEIELELFDLADRLEVRRLHFDRWGSKQLVQHLKDGGLRVFDMGQGFASMSAPTKELNRIMLEGRIAHAANPLLRWAAASLAVKQDPAGNLKPDREKSTGRIDPLVALIMAIDAYTRERGGGSIYEDRGLEVV